MYANDIDIAIAREIRRRKQAREPGAAQAPKVSVWSSNGAVYVNRSTGKQYVPHHDEEAAWIASDTPRYALLKGGEGSGKSVAGIVKGLERLRRGMSGIMGSPDLVHFKKSLWREFQNWCPPNAVIPQHRRMLAPSWFPTQPFTMIFTSGAFLLCGGFEDPNSWEGPNVNWAHFDEARRHREAGMLKVLDGRCRIPGPQGEPPQIFLTTTPRKHWLYQYFEGPLNAGDPDLYEDFRRKSKVVTLRLADNAQNLAEGYAEDRRRTLTSSEARVLADAEWEDPEDVARFLPSMLWWDACYDPDLPPLSPHEPMVLGVDAATGSKESVSDCFAVVGVTRHPRKPDAVAVRVAEYWQAKPGEKISFRGTEDDPGPERFIRRLCETKRVECLAFDPTQMIDMTQRFTEEGLVWCDEFGQAQERLEGDQLLKEKIRDGGIYHPGFPMLTAHIDNADRKTDDTGSKLRIVKGRGKIDLAVALAMANKKFSELSI